MLKNIFNTILPETPQDVDGQAIPPGSFGAIFARAGVGKTALLVQLAVAGMLRGQNILHISTQDPVDKVDLWYREVFQRLSQERKHTGISRSYDNLLRHRFIMTFETETFSVEKLQKRVNELISQEIFTPSIILIDDFNFEKVSEEALAGLKSFVNEKNLVFWFTIRTHRDEPVEENRIPTRLVPVTGWFDMMIRLEPENGRIFVRQVAGENDTDVFFLDPSTLLIRSEKSG